MTDFVDFVHLHCHSEFSAFDGFQKVDAMAARAKSLNMRAIALTDHGKAAGFIAFHKACKKHGIKPIYGVEFYVSEDLTVKKIDRYHLIVLAKNEIGYKNLIKMCSVAHQHTAYGFPRIDFEILKEHKEGLIISTACLGGEFAVNILKNEIQKAREFLVKYKEVFGEDFYLEIMYTGIPEQKLVIKHAIDFSKELGIKIIATNDAHYTERSKAKYQQIKKSISMSKPMKDSDHPEYYIKSYEEMNKIFNKQGEEFLKNTIEVCDKCNVEIKFGQSKLPEFQIPEDPEFVEYENKQVGKTREQNYLRYLTLKRAKEKGLTEEKYLKRIEEELETIRFSGFDRYFLIVQEYSTWGREHGITIGAGRGSCVGSLVLYCLGVIGINSLDYNLSMDRFLYAEAEYRVGKSDICNGVELEVFETSGRGSRYRKTTIEEDARVKRLVAICSERFKNVSQERKDSDRIKAELKFVNNKKHTVAEDILNLYDNELNGNINKPNSYILEILRLTTQNCDLTNGFDFRFILDKQQSRISPPDIDIDFDHREPIVRHMCERYGYDKVALIGNNMMYKPKAAVQFVAKALDITDTNSQDDKRFSSENTQEAIRLSKMMTALPLSLKQWLGEDLDFKAPNQRITKCIEMMQAEKARGGKYEEVFEIAKELCGDDPKGKKAILKSFGTHAAGLIVSSSPITDDIPLHTAKVIKDSADDYSWADDSEEEVEEQEQIGLSTAQFDKNEVEDLGLLKFDFLQIETLRHMNLTMKLIKDRYKELNFNIENLVPNDPNVFKTINDMKLAGIFQLSGDAFVDRYFDSINKKTGEIDRDKDGKPKRYHRDGVMRYIGCSDFKDIVVCNALGRPGPMASGMVKEYGEVKFGRKAVKYDHPLLEKHLKKTYGQLVYQEQMISIAQDLAGFSFSEADNLRRACGHKEKERMEKMEISFREGCRKNGIADDVISRIFSVFIAFAEYGFNESHCLTGDTPVFSADSNLRIPIRDLQPGYNILSYLDGHVVRDSVVELIDTGKQKVFEIELSNGMIIKSTIFHKFWCSDRQYHEVYDIIQDDLEIVSIDPFDTKNVTIVSYKFFGFVKTYNIEMASEQHNYLVGDELDNAIVSANSTGYGYISYQTAYLKTYYPTEFICSILTTEANKNQEKLALMINKFKGNKTEEFPGEYPNLKILKPDINKSEKSYYPVGNLQILAPIFSIKSIGKKVSDTIVEHRKKVGFFSSVEHFFRVVNSGGKAAIAGTVGETLIDAGVFDSLGKREDLKKELKRYFQIKKMVGTKMHQTSNMQELF